jgi:hypothetical protein
VVPVDEVKNVAREIRLRRAKRGKDGLDPAAGEARSVLDSSYFKASLLGSKFWRMRKDGSIVDDDAKDVDKEKVREWKTEEAERSKEKSGLLYNRDSIKMNTSTIHAAQDLLKKDPKAGEVEDQSSTDAASADSDKAASSSSSGGDNINATENAQKFKKSTNAAFDEKGNPIYEKVIDDKVDFWQIREAYDVLCHPGMKRIYDLELHWKEKVDDYHEKQDIYDDKVKQFKEKIMVAVVRIIIPNVKSYELSLSRNSQQKLSPKKILNN